MRTQQSKIIRKYTRRSKSKWKESDDSTILLFATIEDESSLLLKYDQYIYLHRDEVGKWLGISISDKIQKELGDGIGKYRENLDMFEVLLKYHEDILVFLQHFSNEIESVIGIDICGWLELARRKWYSILVNAGRISDS